MKFIIATFAFVISFLDPLALNAEIYVRKADGGWSDLGLWRDKSSGVFNSSTALPGAEDEVVINADRVLSLDMSTSIEALVVANKFTSGTLNIDKYFALRVNSAAVGNDKVGEKQGRGFLNISDGALDINGTLTVFDNGHVTIDGGVLGNLFTGEARSFEGVGTIELKSGELTMVGETPKDRMIFDNALTIVSGGEFDASQTLVGHTSEAELRIVGDAAKIRLLSLNQGDGFAKSGTFHFVLNDTGVSTVEVKSFLKLEAVKLIVDGSNYKGSAQNLTLFSCSRFVSPVRPENISVIGLGEEGVGWRLTQDKREGLVQLDIIRN